MAKLCPPAVKEHSLISVADPNKRGDIVCRDTLEIAQHDDLALAIRQLRQELLNACDEALGHDVIVDTVGPWLGGSDPRPGLVEALVDVVLRASGAQFPAYC